MGPGSRRLRSPCPRSARHWAFKAYGEGDALLADGNSRIWNFQSGVWEDLGIWRDGAYTYALDIDQDGNVWVAGIGGAAKRDVLTGLWQRHRVTNSGQFDTFNSDLAIAPATGDIYACANAGPGVA